MANRDTRSSYTPATAYPSSPTRSSLPFPYSTVRPPTGFSEVETAWSQPSHYPNTAHTQTHTAAPTDAESAPPLPPMSKADAIARRRVQQEQEEENQEADSFEDDAEEYETPLYARSDWDAVSNSNFQAPATASTWSRSSWAGPRTAGTGLMTAPTGGLEGIAEDEEWSPQFSAQQSQKTQKQAQTQGLEVQYAYDQDAVMDSPGQMTGTPGYGEAYIYTPTPRKSLLKYAESSTDSGDSGESEHEGVGRKGRERKSTMALGHLDDHTSLPPPLTGEEEDQDRPGPGKFTDVQLQSPRQAGYAGQGNGTRQRKSYAAQTTPDFGRQPNPTQGQQAQQGQQGRHIMSPTVQMRLGRMSVAPARYTLPGLGGVSSSFPRSRSQKKVHRQQQVPTGTLSVSALQRTYLTWRPFLSPALTLVAALLLTLNNGTSTNSLSAYVKVSSGVFDVSRAGGTGVTLGAWGWCQAATGDDPTCEAYSEGDFANSSGDFLIPDNTTLTALSSLLIALTTLTFFSAAYQLLTAFSHFYLFFILSIPFRHYAEIATTQPKSLANGAELSAMEAVAVAEVDLRVRCERPPFEYGWVWWVWWAHRRSPLGAIWGSLVGALGVGTFIATFLFHRDIISATGTSADNVKLGDGAYIPLVAVILTLDPLISSIKYFWNIKTNWQTFLDPPDPSPAALLIPASEKPLHHYRDKNTNASFFAPRQTTLDALHLPAGGGAGGVDDEFAYDAHAPPLPGTAIGAVGQLGPRAGAGAGAGHGAGRGEEGEEETVQLDAETIRWLAAYPHDDELVPLISDLRRGRENDDFLLSDVGLLYLRPQEGDGGGGEEGALLVPPKGVIRQELVEDAHFNTHTHPEHPPPGAGAGTGAHNGLELMLGVLSRTFWWNGLASDVQAYIDCCKVCQERKRLYEIEAKTGMTQVPFTGLTGWTNTKGMETGWKEGESAMAVEMAVALRKAQEDAER